VPCWALVAILSDSPDRSEQWPRRPPLKDRWDFLVTQEAKVLPAPGYAWHNLCRPRSSRSCEPGCVHCAAPAHRDRRPADSVLRGLHRRVGGRALGGNRHLSALLLLARASALEVVLTSFHLLLSYGYATWLCVFGFLCLRFGFWIFTALCLFICFLHSCVVACRPPSLPWSSLSLLVAAGPPAARCGFLTPTNSEHLGPPIVIHHRRLARRRRLDKLLEYD